MVYVCKSLRQKLTADFCRDRETLAVKGRKDWIEVPFEWQTKQTLKAVLFPSYGWVPRAALAWRRGDMVLPWSLGRDGDTFLMAHEFAKRRAA